MAVLIGCSKDNNISMY